MQRVRITDIAVKTCMYFVKFLCMILKLDSNVK